MAPSPAPVDISRIDKYAPAELIGREAELQLLTDSWNKAVRSDKNRPRVVVFVALGGEGKTALVAKWAANLSGQNWPDCDACFAWSFYSQGSDEKAATSSDLFLKEALTAFGDADDKMFAASSAGAYAKGQRLARVVGAQRILLILDGLEPLQYAPTAPTGSELKDQGIAALLKGLATTSRGLCVVTTRYSVPNLKAFWQSSVREQPLHRLSRSAGVRLLKSLGVKGSDRQSVAFGAGKDAVSEFEKLVEDVKGHALTLTLLGSYLAEFHAGDIRQRDRVKLDDANDETGGHAFRVMDAYVESFETGGHNEAENTKGKRALALLRLLGLFDRPASADCLQALWKPPAIPGLTDLLVEVDDKHRTSALKRLDATKLLTVNRDGASGLVSLDAHPHLRENFAKHLREQQPDAWRAGHKRLYEHLCETTKEGEEPTLEDLQPLYQAVAHGCLAGLQQEVWKMVYFTRIRRGNDFYSVKNLGAFGSDLGVVAGFFESPWNHVSPSLDKITQALAFSAAASWLLALGRLTEALEPMHAGLELGVQAKDWEEAARRASNLSDLESTLGEVAGALEYAARSVTYADLSGDAFLRMGFRTTHADALHQAGHRADAEARFREAEQIQAEWQPAIPHLYSVQGFRYCDLLLAEAERAAWQMMLRGTGFQPVMESYELGQAKHGQDGHATVKIRQGAYLPHWTRDGGIYAVTFRLADSLPASILGAWLRERDEIVLRAKQQSRALSPAEYEQLRKLFSERVEHHLDRGAGDCWMKRPEIARLVQDALRHFDGQRYRLLAWCVMPNHVHVVVKPLIGFQLDKILHSWKSFTANAANKQLSRSGAFWQPEYYDHLIRDEQDLEHALEYVLGNPESAGLKDWKWLGLSSEISEILESGTGFQPVVSQESLTGEGEKTNHGLEARATNGFEGGTGFQPMISQDSLARESEKTNHGLEARATMCRVVSDRTAKIQKRRTGLPTYVLLDIALDHLTLGRAALYEAIREGSQLNPCSGSVADSVSVLRRANRSDYLPLGLLTRAWLRALTGPRTGPDSAQADLDEAWEIAERGPMPLFMADIHLYRARLFCGETPYPWVSARHDLAEARRLIEKCGYWRRKEELEDAEAAAKDWPEASPGVDQSAECPQTPVGKAETIPTPTPVPQPPTNMQKEILSLFTKLRPHQFDELVFVLEVPVHLRPSTALDLERRKNDLLAWAEGPPSSIENLLKELRELVGVSSANPQ